MTLGVIPADIGPEKAQSSFLRIRITFINHGRRQDGDDIPRGASPSPSPLSVPSILPLPLPPAPPLSGPDFRQRTPSDTPAICSFQCVGVLKNALVTARHSCAPRLTNWCISELATSGSANAPGASEARRLSLSGANRTLLSAEVAALTFNGASPSHGTSRLNKGHRFSAAFATGPNSRTRAARPGCDPVQPPRSDRPLTWDDIAGPGGGPGRAHTGVTAVPLGWVPFSQMAAPLESERVRVSRSVARRSVTQATDGLSGSPRKHPGVIGGHEVAQLAVTSCGPQCPGHVSEPNSTAA
ncbi:hypothetical protein AAFF_G00020310 [Aldrovandia affinis]|uniref:Uncharacterized protein n=1 Tax=Aldrovandia affinis TaxID=143900 RepID=A0AAD7WHF9_9TELE|nr:hypothetical protein AAFF_G00020310 [Aldrovandia affinis]